RGCGSCGRLAFRAFPRRRILYALHVACLTNEAGHLGKASTLDADVGEDRVDQGGLHAVAQRRVDDLVGGAAAAAAAPAVEAVHLEDADALDLLHRLDALAHDALDAVQQFAAEQRVARLIGQHVLRLVEQALRLGLDRGADALGSGGDPRLLGLLLGDQYLDGLAPLGDLAFARGYDALGRLRRVYPCIFRRCPGRGF